MRNSIVILPSLLLMLGPLAGCDQLGIEDPAKVAALKEAEGKAIGSACRQTGRALEDCFELNPRALKSAIFAGWREMDGYMRDNKLEIVPRQPPETKASEADGKAADNVPESKVGKTDKPADKTAEKPAAKAPDKTAAKH
jgi:hypothetical protein